MPTTVFLSIRGEGASRLLESFRRTLGEEGASLVVVPTNDENGYHGSAEVADVAAAREAFALARKGFPTLKAYLGVAGDAPPRPSGPSADSRPSRGSESRPPRGGDGRGRGGERPQESREGRGRPGEPRQQRAQGGGEQETSAEGGERAQRRNPLRGRNRSQRRQVSGDGTAPTNDTPAPE